MRLPFFTHRVTVSGLNLERFINTMRREGISLLRIRRTDRRALVCECPSADLPRLSALADEKGWRVEQVRPLGLSALVCAMRRRPGIPIGLLAALLLALGLSQFVWRIEIHDAGAYRADLAASLQEWGCVPGTLRSRVNVRKLERDLTHRYPEIAWFHVYVSGITLVMDVTQGVSMPSLPSSSPGDVCAVRSGMVDSVRVSAGTAVVRSGDLVRRGQVLIRGEERGPDGSSVPVHAAGVVMARCWESETVTMPLYEIRSEETGRETVQTRIWTPWFTWPGLQESPDYLACNTYLTQYPVGGSFFPAAYQVLRFCEVQMEYTPADAEKVRVQAGEAAERRLKDRLYGYEIIDKWTDYCMIEDNTLAATATAEWLMDIGGPVSP